jgi:4-azaleucine resistance transporter AzlC
LTRIRSRDVAGVAEADGAHEPVDRPATFVDGVRASLPIAVGYFPIAFSFGVAATNLGFSVAEAVFLSVVIYSGASQFMALTLLSGGTAVGVSTLTLLAMNLRHLLYGPSLLERAGTKARTRFSWAWAYGLTDEVYAATIGFLAGRSKAWTERWMLGIGAASNLSWVTGTAVGAFAGGGTLAAYPAVEAALGFMLPALFLSLLLAILSRTQAPVVAVAASVCALVTLWQGTTTGILAGMVAGAVVGARRREPAVDATSDVADRHEGRDEGRSKGRDETSAEVER